MSKLDSAIKDWIIAHPYLQEIAKLQKLVVTVLTKYSLGDHFLENVVLNRQQIVQEMQRGLPALASVIWHEEAIKMTANILRQLVATFAVAELPTELNQQSQRIQKLFEENPVLADQLVKKVLEEQGASLVELAGTQINDGVITFLVWSALAPVLEPLRLYVQEWQKEGQWRRAYCPLCGQLPAMAQLIRTDKGRERDLVCGCCHTRWRYKRLGCPYCENEDDLELNIIEPAETPDLRLDTCARCKGYLKTYTGEGNEQVVLADWSTLHLDAIGKYQGFQRMGYQLYKL